jgi:transposase-like protein
MNPQQQLCPHCQAKGKDGKIGIHSRQQQRYRCKQCGRTFSHTHGSAVYGLKKAELFGIVVSLLAYGCPPQAIMATYRLSDKTVRDWARRAGGHCQALHEQTVMRSKWDLQHIQADELKVSTQQGVVWIALVMMVSTRLWLGASVHATRGKTLIRECLQYAARCALCRPLLLAVDGLNMYVKAAAHTFRSRHRLQGQRPRWFGWSEVVITQVVKKRGGKRGSIERVVVQGCPHTAQRLRLTSQGGTQINSAFIERLNATFRQRIAPLARRSRAQARLPHTLTAAVFLQGCVYNFCTDHRSLAIPLYLTSTRRHWIRRTPAMSAGLTDHRWSVDELLRFNLNRGKPCPPRYST